MPTGGRSSLLLWQVVAHPYRQIAVAAAALAAVAGCTGGGNSAPETTAIATTTTQPPRVNDGRLRIGILLPTSDALLGQGLVDASRLAIERINDAGGVLGQPVTFEIADEGETTAAASAAIETLVEADVDAIVGPASSITALNNLAEIVDAGVVSCSPTASALALDDFPDDLLFFRTIPSDSLQAVAIAQVVEETGAQAAVIASIDDAYGQQFAEAVESALVDRGIAVGTSVMFRRGDEDLDAKAAELVASDARAAVILAADADALSLLEVLGPDLGNIDDVIVNDALRNSASATRIAALAEPLRRRITGVAPQAIASDPADPDGGGFGPYAVNAFDCVNLIALAAVQGQSDAPRIIKTQMQSVSAGGSLCRTYASCLERLAERLQINYNGPAGITELLPRGDPRRARFELFTFDETGRDQTEGSSVVEG